MLIETVTEDKQIEVIETLAREIWNEHFIPIIGQAQVDYMLEKFQSKNSIIKQIEQGYQYFLLKNEQNAIGYMGVYPEDQLLFLSKLYILASERNKGYGKQALQFLEQLALQNDLKTITLTVNKYNLDTIAAYKKLGFKNTGAIVQDIGNHFVMDDYKMAKTITPA